MSRLLQAAALVLYVLAALLAFDVFSGATILHVLGFVAAGLACMAASLFAP